MYYTVTQHGGLASIQSSPIIPDGFARAERAVIDAQRLDDGSDLQRHGSVRRAKVGTEPAPAELAFLAAISKEAVDDEGDDLRAAVHGDDDVLRLAHLDRALVAVP